MKINLYSYDNVNNPRCGGGGAYRDLMISKQLSGHHQIKCYTGKFKGANPHADSGVQFYHLGWGSNYLLSRITFSIFATIHSLFSGADLIVISYSVYSPVFTFFFRAKKTIVQLYHRVGNIPFKKYGPFGAFPWLAEKAVLYFGRNFITLTDSFARDIISDSSGKSKATATSVAFDKSLLTKKPTEGNYILYFGRIDIKMKGIDTLIDAFKKVADNNLEYNLIIAGRGNEKDIQWVISSIEKSGLRNRMKLIVNPPDEEKKKLLHSCVFVCLPSRFEGWNIVALEAAASSKATLGSRIHGLVNSIKENETGILVAPEDSNALAGKMDLLLNDKRLRKKLGENGNKWARNFTWEKVAELQEGFYLDVLNNAKK